MKKQSAAKRVLSLMLSVLLVLSTVTVGFPYLTRLITSDAYAETTAISTYDSINKKLIINDGATELRILQVADIQSTAPLYEDVVSLIRQGIARVNPHLIVLTGDNIIYASEDESYAHTAAYIASLFKDANGNSIPFAVTFGNHDTHNNSYLPDKNGGEEILQQYNFWVSELGAIDYNFLNNSNDIIHVGTGCVNVYSSSDTSTIIQKVLILNSATSDTSGYGKLGYNQEPDYSKNNKYNELCVRIYSEVSQNINIPIVAFQHIPLREFYTASGILISTGTDSDDGSIKAYSDIDSDLTLNGTAVTSQYFKADTHTTGEYNEACCCSYTSTQLLYVVLANHSTDVNTTYEDNPMELKAHNNVKGIFYGHDHSNTLTGTGTVKYYNTDFTLTQGYGGGMCIKYGNADAAFISGYTMYTDVNKDIEKYTWDTESINVDYDTTFGAKHTVNGISASQTYVCDIAFGMKGANILRRKSVLVDGAVEKAINYLKNKYPNYAEQGINFVGLNTMTNGDVGDLNAGSQGDYIGMAYATTTNVADALTDIVARVSMSPEHPDTLTKEKYGTVITYHLLYEQDMNDSTGGAYVYLYGTKDPLAGPPITALGIVKSDSNNDGAVIGGYYQTIQDSANNALQNPVDMNEGCGSGTDYLLIETKTIGSVTSGSTKDTTTFSNYDITCQYFELAKAIKENGSLANASTYTTSSLNAYKTALINAKNMKEEIDVNRYVNFSKQQIIDCATALNTAYDALEIKVVDYSEQVKHEGSDDNRVLVAVPDTIYLRRSTGDVDKPQYFLNNKLEKSTSEEYTGNVLVDNSTNTEGSFQVFCDNATSINVKVMTYEQQDDGSYVAQTDYHHLNGGERGSVTKYTGEDSLSTVTDLGGGKTTAAYDTNDKGQTVDGEYFDGVIYPWTQGSFAITNNIAPGHLGYVEWTITVTLSNGETVVKKAYTTLYSPPAESSSTVATMANFISVRSNMNSNVTATVWITGIQNITTHSLTAYDRSSNGTWSTFTPYENKAILDSPLSDDTITTFEYSNSDYALSSIQNGNGMFYLYANETSDEGADLYLSHTGKYKATLTVDTSRFTNYNQIPDLKIGTDIHTFRSASDDTYLAYGYSFSNTDYDTTAYRYSATTTVPNVYYGSNGETKTTPTVGRQSTTINQAVSASNTKLSLSSKIVPTAKKSNGYKWRSLCLHTYCDITYVNKADLRDLVEASYQLASQERWVTDYANGSSAKYTAFLTALRNAAVELGDPTDTDVTAVYNALNTAKDALTAATLGNASVKVRNYKLIKAIDSATGTSAYTVVNATPDKDTAVYTVKPGDKFYIKAMDFDGFSYVGCDWTDSADTADLTGTISTYNVDTTAQQLVYPQVTYQVGNTTVDGKSNGLTGTYNFYYTANDYTLTIDLNGGTGIGYTSVIGNTGSTLTLPTVSRTGYTFAGWSLSGGGQLSGKEQNSEYTFGNTNGTLTAVWNASVQTVTLDTAGGYYPGNLVYIKDGAASAYSETLTAEKIIKYTSSYEADGDLTISGTSSGSKEKTNEDANLCVRLAEGHRYNLSFDSTNAYTDVFIYLASAGMAAHSDRMDYYSGSTNGIYHYTINFEVGENGNINTEGNSESSWQDSKYDDTLTGVYNIRVDQRAEQTGAFTVTNFKLTEIEKAGVAPDTYQFERLAGDTMALPLPQKAGSEFSGWDITPDDNNTYVGYDTMQVGLSATTLTATWEPLVITYDINYGNSTANMYVPDATLATQNGISYAYDPLTGIITLNGTCDSSDITYILETTNRAFEPTEGTYRFSIIPISGSFTGAWNNCFVFDLTIDGLVATDSARRHTDITQQTLAKGEPVSWNVDLSLEEARTYDGFVFHIYQNNHTDGLIFNNYKFKIKIDRVPDASDSISAGAVAYTPNARIASGTTYGTDLIDLGSTDYTLFARAGYTFIGWATTSNGTRPVYENGEQVGVESTIVKATDTLTHSQTLYAQWSCEKVTYDNLFNISTFDAFSRADSGSTLQVDTASGEIAYTNMDKAMLYTVSEGYRINVKPNTEYQFKFKLQNTSDQLYGDVSINYYDANGEEIDTYDNTYTLTFNDTTSGDILHYAEQTKGMWGSFNNTLANTSDGYIVFTFTTPANVANLRIRFGSDMDNNSTDSAGQTATFSDVVLYPTKIKATNGKNINYTDISYGDLNQSYASNAANVGALITPTTTGYDFVKWVDNATGLPVSGSPAASAYPNGITLISTWEPKNYTVRFINDGTVLQKSVVAYGDTPVILFAEPTRTATAQYTYAFSGWDHNVEAITGDTDYIAQYDNTLNTYTVVWNNYDGTKLKTDKDVPYGTTPAYKGDTPTKPATAQYTYTFSGWNPAIATVTGDAVYTAKYDETVNKYSITWKNDNGDVLRTDSVAYGATPSYGATPTKNYTQEIHYEFAGWSPAVDAVTGEATYKATYTTEDHTVNDIASLSVSGSTSYTVSGNKKGACACGYEKTLDNGEAAATLTGNFNNALTDANAILNNPAYITTSKEYTDLQTAVNNLTALAGDNQYTQKQIQDKIDAVNTALTAMTTAQNDSAKKLTVLKNYTLNFDLAGGTLVGTAPTNYTYIDSVTLPHATKKGYVLAGYTAATNGTGESNWGDGILTGTQTDKYGAVTLSAVWQEDFDNSGFADTSEIAGDGTKAITVTFTPGNENKGKLNGSSDDIVVNTIKGATLENLMLYKKPTVGDFATGWKFDNEHGNWITTGVTGGAFTENGTLTPDYQEKGEYTVTVKYMLQNTTGDGYTEKEDARVVEVDCVANKPYSAYDKPFTGFSPKADNTYSITVQPNNDNVILLYYDRDIKTLTINIEYEGAETSDTKVETQARYGADVIYNVPAKEGYLPEQNTVSVSSITENTTKTLKYWLNENGNSKFDKDEPHYTLTYIAGDNGKIKDGETTTYSVVEGITYKTSWRPEGVADKYYVFDTYSNEPATVNANTTVTLTFAEDFNNNGTADTSEPKVDVTFKAGEHGTLIGETKYKVVKDAVFEAIAKPKINADTYYLANNWSVNPDTTISANAEITAQYQEDFNKNKLDDATEPKVNLTFEKGAHGKLEGTLTKTVVKDAFFGAISKPTVTADEFYLAGGWDIADTAQLTNADNTVTAQYYEDFNKSNVNDALEAKVNLTFDKGTHGSLTGVTDLKVVTGAYLCTVQKPTIVPDEYYLNGGWDTPDTAQLSAADNTVTAKYLEDFNKNNIDDATESNKVSISFNKGEHGALTGQTAISVVKDAYFAAIPKPTVVANKYYIANGWDIADATQLTNATNTATAQYLEDFNNSGIDDAKESKVTLTFSAGAHGNIEGQKYKQISVVTGCSKNFITLPEPTADANWVFKGWNSSLPDNVTFGNTYTAQYAADLNGNDIDDTTEPIYIITFRFVDDDGNSIGLDDVVVSSIENMPYSVILKTLPNYVRPEATLTGTMSNTSRIELVKYYIDADNNGIPDNKQNLTVIFKVNGKEIKKVEGINFGESVTPPTGTYYEYNKTGHRIVDTWDKDCNYITGDTEINGIGTGDFDAHVFDAGVIDTQAKCYLPGTKKFTCSCGYVKTEIYTVNHNYVAHDAKAPTCTEIGWDAYETCSNEGCNYTTYQAIPAKGHKYGEWTVVERAKTTAPGRRIRTCSVCLGVDEEYFNVDFEALLTRTVKFNNISKMHYLVQLVDDDDITSPVYQSGTVKWYSDQPLYFKLYIYTNSGYTNLYVYSNGVRLNPDENGVYTLPAGSSAAYITVSPFKLDADEPTTQEGGGTGTGTTTCSHMCHTSNSFLQILWTIVNLFNRLLGKNQYCSCGASHY